MAIFHLNAKTIGRNQGRSATAAAAYRAGVRLVDERTGLVFDFTRKRGVDGAEILAPEGATPERGALWNAVEKAEKRVDAQVAREVEVALPRELTPDDMRRLVRAFVQEQFVAKGMLADIAFHNLTGTNPHAHILLTLREWSTAGFGLKRREWNDRALCAEWRDRWADHANAALSAAGQTARVDPRTLTEQAADAAERGETDKAIALTREPTIHERGNPAARAHNRAVAEQNEVLKTRDTPATFRPASAPAVIDDAAFITAILASSGAEAARWRMYHEEVLAEEAWLKAHADDERQHEEAYRSARLVLHNARYQRDEWLQANRRPFWPWRWRSWRRRKATLQVVVDRAKQSARKARSAVDSDSVIARATERNAHEERRARALRERRRLAELPSEQQARHLSTASNLDASAEAPKPTPEITTDKRRRFQPH
jgi:hypothetical protein